MTSPQSEAPARQRIAKLMARVGLCSRRDAEAWIVDGRVSVNGETLTSPAIDVGPGDAILIDGAPLPAVEKTRLFLFHKPRGLVTSDRDPEGRATVADHLREHWRDGPRVVTVGRLDINTEGLLLLTNDGGLARVLELPKTGWVRRYRVRAKGETDQAVLDALRDGVTIDGIDYAGIEATLDRTQGANVWLTMGLREGKNREVKRVLEHIGLEVNRLIRLSFGPFQLGELAEGAVEEVRTRVLRDQLGAALAAAASVVFEDAVASPAKPARVDRKPGRTAGAEQVNKGERPASSRGLETRGTRDERGRGGNRPLRRSPAETPSPVRERPAVGPRKHVSALRAAESEVARRGPRRRIERGDLTDRRDRPVAVERLVGADPGSRSGPLEPTRTRREDKSARHDGPGATRGPGGRQASPSALAKRARTARSGGPSPDRDEAPPRRRDRDGARADAPRQKYASKRPTREEGAVSRARSACPRARSAYREKPGDRPVSGDRRQPTKEHRESFGRQRSGRNGASATRGDRQPAREDGRRERDERATSDHKTKRFDPQRSEARAERSPRAGRRDIKLAAQRPERRGGPDQRERGGTPRSRTPALDGGRPRGPSRGKPSRPKR